MNGGKIYKAITDAMAEISPIAKAKKNEQQRFYYRGIDDVMNELHPILAKHKIFFRMDIMGEKREDRQTKTGGNLIYSIITAKCYFATDDGSEVYTTVIGEGMDSGDKASNKAMAVAMKYACLQMFCIPTEDMNDPDSETPPQSTPKNGQQPEQQSKPPSGKAVEGKAIVARIGEIMKALDPDGKSYFSETAKAEAREVIQTNDLEKVKAHCAMLEGKLAVLRAPPDDHFEDDIPF